MILALNNNTRIMDKTQQHRKAIFAVIFEKKKVTPQEIQEKTQIPFIVIYGIMKPFLAQGLIVEETNETGKTYILTDEKKVTEELKKLDEPKPAKDSTDAKGSKKAEKKDEKKEAGKTKPVAKTAPPASVVPKMQKEGRDTRKFRFQNETRGKGPTVLAILQAYVAEKKPVLAKIKDAFPDAIVSKWKVVELLSKAKEHESEGGRQRYFTKPDQLLITKDGKKLAVTNQWDVARFEAFLEAAKKVGYKVKVVESQE